MTEQVTEVTAEMNERDALILRICENWGIDSAKQLNYKVDHKIGPNNNFLKFGPLSVGSY